VLAGAEALLSLPPERMEPLQASYKRVSESVGHSPATGGWHASIDGNLTATFVAIKSVLRDMKMRRTGTIISLSSAAVRKPHPAAPIPHATAKAGLQILARHLAEQATVILKIG
jgi:NAD(P)-dependent dehydrogenase (short-subunit alcohol dehydrogenase family)